MLQQHLNYIVMALTGSLHCVSCCWCCFDVVLKKLNSTFHGCKGSSMKPNSKPDLWM